MTESLEANMQRLVQFFEEHGRTERYKKGEYIERPFNTSSTVHLLKEGYVRVFAVNDRGEEHTHVIYRPQEFFPLLWINHDPSYDVYDVALTDCEVIHVGRAEMLEAIGSDVGISNAVLAEVVDRTRIFVARINNLEYKFARERLVYRLLFMCGRFGKKREDGSYLIEVPITQNILATSINLSRESVSREFERLVDQGLVEHEGPRLVIRNVPQLAAEFKSPPDADWWGLVAADSAGSEHTI